MLVTFGKMIGPYDEREPVPIVDEIERRYAVSQVRRRIHQVRFRGEVVPAYADQCAICRLKELRLLDAAHIVADRDEAGAAVVINRLGLCSFHHRAYDHDLVGVSPEGRVHVSRAPARRRGRPDAGAAEGLPRTGHHRAARPVPPARPGAAGGDVRALPGRAPDRARGLSRPSPASGWSAARRARRPGPPRAPARSGRPG
ncbi:MAG: hypothetical protein K2X91_10935 [Thermoleophilia bacterium]|nr:hypothetical protein [Thermoleophilia bacterium]